MANNVIEYTAEDMKRENLSKNHLTLVDFWAAWCGPCRMLGPIIEELAGETEGVTFAKVNVDDNIDIAMGLGISAIPTVVLFRDGEAVDRAVGMQGKEALADMIARHR